MPTKKPSKKTPAKKPKNTRRAARGKSAKALALAKRSRRIRLVAGSVSFAAIIATCGLSFTLQNSRPHTKTPLAKPQASQPVAKPKATSAVSQPAPPKIVPDYTIPPIINGLAPLLTHIPTSQPVVFLGIDDGANKEPFELALMKANHIKATLFLANRFISEDPSFFNDFVKAGSVIENHTINHRLLSGLSYQEQKQEICGEADIQQQQFGRRPILFRPPGGDYDTTTLQAAADCGMKAVVNWIAKANGGAMQYQVGDKLRPGDIVLMHFRPEFAKDMQAFLDAQKAAGLHTELLEDWLAQ